MASNDINTVAITGNLTADPTLRATKSGTAVLNFRIASNYSVKNKTTGEWESRPNYVSCVVLGARAEPLSRILAKGRKVCVAGSLRYREWQGEDGQQHSMLEIHADSVVLMSMPSGNGAQGDSQPQRADDEYTPDWATADLPF